MPTTPSSKSSLQFWSGYTALTYSDIQTFLGKTLTTAEQSLVTSIIAVKEVEFAKRCKRNFLDSSTNYYVEKVDAGQQKIYLRNFPIHEVLKISLDGTIVLYDKTQSTNQYTLGVDFAVSPVALIFNTVPYSMKNFNVMALSIEYDIETVVNEDIKDIIKKMVAVEFCSKQYGGITPTSLNANGIQISFGVDGFTKEIESAVYRYRAFTL